METRQQNESSLSLKKGSKMFDVYSFFVKTFLPHVKIIVASDSEIHRHSLEIKT